MSPAALGPGPPQRPRRGWRTPFDERPRPNAVRGRPQAPWLVVGTVCIGAFMGQLDASIAIVAVPTLAREFHASLAAVEWVLLSYLLVLVGAVATVGRIADMIGRKQLYISGFGVFAVASAGCALAPGLVVLICLRVVQALGAAMLQANSVALISATLPGRLLNRGIGIQGAAQAIGLALGPGVGGLLIGAFGWRSIFLINVPVGMVGMVMGWYLLPRSRDLQPRARLDWAGSVLLAGSATTLLLVLSFGRRLGIALVILLSGVALVAAALFVVQERRVDSPVVPPWLLRRSAFAVPILAGLLGYVVLFGTLLVVPIWWQRAHGLGAVDAGVRLTALPLALGLVAPGAGWLADRAGTRAVTAAGMLGCAAALAVLGSAHGSGVVLPVLELATVGAALGFFVPANNAAIMAAAPRSHAGVASGVLNMTRGIGTSLGVALTGLVYTAAAGAGTAGARGLTGGQAAAEHGFTVAMLALAAVAAVAATLVCARPARTAQ